MFSPFRMVCPKHLPAFLLWLLFLKYTCCFICIEGWLYLLLGKGYKSAFYLWRKSMQSGYKTTFENIASVLFTAELYSLIPTTRRHHSRSGSRIFICEKKGRVSFSLTEILVVNKKKKQLTAGLSLGAVLSRREGVIPIPACSKNAVFFLSSPEKYFSNKRNKKWTRCSIAGWESMLSMVLRGISFAFCMSLNFPPVPKIARWDWQ